MAGSGRSFAPAEKFAAEVAGRKLRPAYVLIGDEVFFRDQCRQALLEHLVPADLRDFSLHDLDLADVSVAEVLDRARTPSLMAPFQVFFVRGVKELYTRGSHADEFAAIEAYMKDPNPDAVLIFVADHISIPADARRMEMQDRDRFERIRETLGEYCGMVELARVEEGDGMRWIIEQAQKEGVKVDQDAARELDRRAGRGHDAGQPRTGKADALCRRKKAHHAGRRGDHGPGRQAALAYTNSPTPSPPATKPARSACWTRCSPPVKAMTPPSATFICWPAPSARCW